MLRYVATATQPLDPYEEHAPAEQVQRVRELARSLQGVRVLQLNATAYGGGVAELLNSIVPLEKGLGLDVKWGVLVAEPAFFTLTKRLHNALQGGPWPVAAPEEVAAYIRHNQHIADEVRDQFDVVLVHDPQPAPVQALTHDGARWIWRVHIDLSAYNQDAWAFLQPYVEQYDAFVFTMPEFVPGPVDRARVHCFAPGIDPLSPKNMPLPQGVRSSIVRWAGVDPDRPLLTQVSRFDPWKDPIGVLRVYRELRQKHSGLQLALLGSMALDDPEGWDVYNEVTKAAGDDPAIHIGTNFTGIGNLEINAFQTASSVVIQKSVREGFGLIVSETLWKGTPIVAGRTGGIPMQMEDGRGGFLVSREEDWAPRIDALLSDPAEATRTAGQGRERIRRDYLITRLLADELSLIADLLGRPKGTPTA